MTEYEQRLTTPQLQKLKIANTGDEPMIGFVEQYQKPMTHRIFKQALLNIVWLSLYGCSSSNPVTTGVADEPWMHQFTVRESGPGFTFRSGDILELYVLEDSTLDGKFPVRQTGDVIISRLGRVPASGKTAKEIETDIKQRLQSTQLKAATVIVDTSAVFGDGSVEGGRPKVSVYVHGQVMKQGLQEIPSVRGQHITCLDAIVHSGGFSPFANRKKVTIVRKTIGQGNYTIPVNLVDVEDGRANDVTLQTGDIIKVPQKMFGLGF